MWLHLLKLWEKPISLHPAPQLRAASRLAEGPLPLHSDNDRRAADTSGRFRKSRDYASEVVVLGNACGILPRPMPKDREFIKRLAGHVRVVVLRSTARPVEYAILLQRRGKDGWETVIGVDNAHEGERRNKDIDDHHCHVYSEGSKQSPESLPFDVSDANDAMAKAIRWFVDDWEELIS